MWLIKKVGSTETLLVDAGNVSGYTQTAGSRLNVKVDSVTTGGSTTLRTKVWPAGTGEPAGWMATATDSLAALQAAGEIDLSGYVPGSVTNGPLEFSFDDLNVSGQAGTHAAPVAGFTHTESGLTSTFDSSSTTTSDNATITGYAWDFGDGSNGTQASPNHKYADAGTYQVSLVVTDSRGSQSQPVSKLVTVTGTSLDVFAADAFGRTVGSGWGAADVGGSWTGTTGFSVAGGVGLASVPTGVTRTTALSVSVGDSTSTFTLGVDKPVAGGTAQFNYALHKSGAGEYRLKLNYLSTGQVQLWLTKKVGSTETLLKDGGTLAGFTQTAGATLHVKVDSATTGGGTTLRIKVWPTGTTEPAAWRNTTTDSEAALQAAGQIGLAIYTNSSVTNGPIGFNVDDLTVN